jgi:hypothetical protein
MKFEKKEKVRMIFLQMINMNTIKYTHIVQLKKIDKNKKKLLIILVANCIIPYLNVQKTKIRKIILQIF